MTREQSCWTGIALIGILSLFGQGAWPQQGRLGRPPRPSIADDSAPPDSGHSSTRKMLKANYEQLQKDVQHLSDLADELKDEVTNTDDEDVLSLSGVKKAEEIEKLAKKIQGRMKNL